MLKVDQQTYKKFQEYLKVKDTPGETEQKLWKKVYRYTPVLRFIPGVLFVGVGNSLSMNGCHENSDIDLFIITRRNRLWTVRILTTLYFIILRQRKTGKKHAGKFCLSFFVTKDALDFSSFAISDDIYLYFWIVYMKPIINKENTYEQFLRAQKSWVDFSEYEYILRDSKRGIVSSGGETEGSSKLAGIHAQNMDSSPRGSEGRNYEEYKSTVSVLLIPAFAGITRTIGNIFEILLKKLFLSKTKKSFQKLGRPFGVIISDDILKFHDNDRRKEISESL